MAGEHESGFTLLEMLVALSVISIAALALVRLDAYAVRTAGDLDESTMAGVVAQNRAVEVRLTRTGREPLTMAFLTAPTLLPPPPVAGVPAP